MTHTRSNGVRRRGDRRRGKRRQGRGKVSNLRKVTNSISAQGEVKKIVRGSRGTGQGLAETSGSRASRQTERRGVARCAALSGRTADTAPHCTAKHSRACTCEEASASVRSL